MEDAGSWSISKSFLSDTFLDSVQGKLGELLKNDLAEIPTEPRENWEAAANDLLWTYLNEEGLKERLAWISVTYRTSGDFLASQFKAGNLVDEKQVAELQVVSDWLNARILAKETESFTGHLIGSSSRSKTTVSFEKGDIERCVETKCNCLDEHFDSAKRLNEHFDHLEFNGSAIATFLSEREINENTEGGLRGFLAAYHTLSSRFKKEAQFYFIAPRQLPSQQFANAAFIAGNFKDDLGQGQLRMVGLLLNYIFGTHLIADHVQARKEALQSAMRAGVSRVQGRSLSHGIGSGTLQKLAVHGELRKALGRDKNDPDQTSPDPGSDMLQLLRAAHEALCSPNADLDQVRVLLSKAMKIHTDKALVSPKAEEELQHMFRVVKDRMELLSQVATVRSGLMETWAVRDMVDLYNRSDMLVRPMVRDGLFSKLSFSQRNLQVGMVEGRIGVCGALFTLLDGIIRNVSRHTEATTSKFIVKAEQETAWPLVRMEVHHPWQVREMDEKFKQIQTNVDDDTLDASGAVRRYAWGIMEQKQVCAFLRELDMTEVDRSHEPRLLTIGRYQDKKNAWWLKHVFYLPQPRSLLRVSKDLNGEAAGTDESGRVIEMAGWSRYPIACLESAIEAEVKDLALPSRSVVLADVSEKSGAVVWRAYLDRLLASRRGVRLCLYDHDKLERAICVGDQTAPLVVAVHDHPGIDADKYQQDAEANNGELVMQHAMGSTSPFSELYRVMSTDGELGETWCARMAEAAITPIVILDERVQEAAWPNTSRRHGKELEAMGVFVPDLEATGDLKATTPAQVDAYLTRLKSSRPWTHEVPKRYLIIHRSVMQRLNSLGAADKYPGSFKDAGYEVRIVSGAAGGPEIGMGDDPYVALAGLEQHAIRVPCKWQLSEMVVTARNQQKRT